MKHPRLLPLAALALLLAGGCATDSYPHITYPATYTLQVGNSQVSSSYGPQSSNVTAAQRVTVAPDVPLYYAVVSPVAVTVYVYQDNSDGTRTLVGQMQGMTFNSSVTPATSALEFAFAVTNANSSGTLQFTISDQPLATAAPPPAAPPPALPAQ
ncbi:MAG TPA: hypothetical protein VHC86_10505 [Opitutaceae bacterium]|nr:hypothetical protein [Opitutaceae bacterium]